MTRTVRMLYSLAAAVALSVLMIAVAGAAAADYTLTVMVNPTAPAKAISWYEIAVTGGTPTVIASFDSAGTQLTQIARPAKVTATSTWCTTIKTAMQKCVGPSCAAVAAKTGC